MIPHLASVRTIALCAVVALAAPTVAQPLRPLRIVSLNPCVDAILMRVAAPAQIAAISHYSHDPRATSISLTQAMRFAVTSGTAEEVVGKRPDLVFAGQHVALPTILALQRLGIPLIKLTVPESIAESRAQVTTIARAVGAPARGARLNAAIDAAVRHAENHDGRLVPALIWQGGGMVPGAGTLADELLRRAGFLNMSAVYGLKKWDVLPLEYLLARPPAVLFSVSGKDARQDRMLSHPVMQRLSRQIAMTSYPSRLLHCAGPTIIDAVNQMAQSRLGARARS